MKSENYPLSRKENIVIQELEAEILIYDLVKNKAFCLNQMSALVWEACDGNRSVADIAQTLSENFKTFVPDDYVWLALDKLKSEDLLANGKELTIDFKGLSRREVIKKVGLASLIALPIVASLVAPTSVAAQSSCGCHGLGSGGDAGDAGCPCSGNNDCCGNCNGGTMTCSSPLTTCLSPGAACCPPNISVPPASCFP